MNEMMRLENLSVTFTKKGFEPQTVVKNIDLSVKKGSVTGIVGESGSGKSVTMKSLLGLLPDNATVTYDQFDFNGQKRVIGDKHNRIPASMIFQDPMTSLNPLRTVGYHLVEVIQRQQKISKTEAEKLAVLELNKVGIPLPEKRLKQYPHELSGGMRQRIMIAMALLAKPEILIADEPTTALDVTIQAQILSLLKRLQQDEDLTVVLVTHDFGVVAGMCQYIKVMYAGRIVEEGTVEDIFYHPQHPYTKELLKAIPSGDKKNRLYSLDRSEIGFDDDSLYEMISISESHRLLQKKAGV